MKKNVIIDIDIGNVLSVKRAINHLGYQCIISKNIKEIATADSLIIPGDGAFGDTIKAITQRNLTKVILNHVENDKPFLGICVGMQILGTYSEEFGHHKGLNIIPGKIIKFPSSKLKTTSYKIPHLGWNNLNQLNSINNKKNSILNEVNRNESVYFIHSYYFIPNDKKYIVTTTKYANINYASIIQKNNIIGCQFHPEKSGRTGLKILNNFLKLSAT